MSVCDWFSKLFYKKAFGEQFEKDFLDSIYNPAALRECEYKEYPKMYVPLHTAADLRRSTFDEAFAPKPETVESVLNQFIALGYEKPVVVIKGESYADGKDAFYVYVEGELIASQSTVAKAEEWAILELSRLYSRIVVGTTKITY